MKKILLCLSVAAMLFTSCSDDDDNDNGLNVSQDDIMKRWYHQAYSFNGVNIPYDDHEVCGMDYIEFLEDNVFRGVDVYDCNGTTPIQDAELGTWSLSNGDQLTISSGSGSESATATIIHISETELHVRVAYDFDDDGDDDEVVEKYTTQFTT